LKRVVVIFSLLLSFSLLAFGSEWEGIILAKMLQSMSTNRVVSVYTKDKELQKELKNSYIVKIVQTCQKSDFVFVRKDEADPGCKKPLIVFDYYQYLHTKDAVAVFFWQKGRPTIRFSQKRLQHFDLKVRGELSKFVSGND